MTLHDSQPYHSTWSRQRVNTYIQPIELPGAKFVVHLVPDHAWVVAGALVAPLGIYPPFQIIRFKSYEGRQSSKKFAFALAKNGVSRGTLGKPRVSAKQHARRPRLRVGSSCGATPIHSRILPVFTR